MIVHHARRHLIDVTGLPYGLLSATYRVTDVTLLCERSFWWGLLSHGKTLRLGILMFLVALLSVLVGPSCAIMMIPNSDFYPHPDLFGNKTGRLFFYRPSEDFQTATSHTIDYVYPSNLSGDATFNATYCAASHTGDSNYRRCPGGIYDDVLGWAWKDLGYSFGTSNVSTVYESDSRFLYQAVSSLVDDGKTAPTVMSAASVTHESLVRTFGSLWNDIQLPELYGRNVNETANRTIIQLYASESSPVFDPVVQAQCTFFGDSRNINSSKVQLSADGMLSFAQGKGWSVQQDTVWSVPQTAVENILKLSATTSNATTPTANDNVQYYVEWVDAAAFEASGSFSVAALVSAPLGLEEGALYATENVRLLVPCVFSAYWMPATFLLDPQARISVQSNWSSSTNPMAEALQAIKRGENPNARLPEPLHFVNVSADWAFMLHGIDGLLLDMLNPAIHDEDYASTDSAQSSPLAAWTFLSKIVPGFAAAFTLGLANFGAEPTVELFESRGNSRQDITEPATEGLVGSTFVSWNGSDPMPDVYEINAEANRYGYAFGARTPTVRFGFAIILIYLATLAIYVLYALWDQLTTHPYAITSFGGSHDIVTLAMNSKPPDELVNCGAGVKDRHTWQQWIKVRAHEAVEKPKKLELVFRDRANMGEVRVGEKYG
ncbi:MAG: hypothetical protein Q9190_007972 [Brigantiaea leucoxantha]